MCVLNQSVPGGLRYLHPPAEARPGQKSGCRRKYCRTKGLPPVCVLNQGRPGGISVSASSCGGPSGTKVLVSEEVPQRGSASAVVRHGSETTRRTIQCSRSLRRPVRAKSPGVGRSAAAGKCFCRCASWIRDNPEDDSVFAFSAEASPGQKSWCRKKYRSEEELLPLCSLNQNVPGGLFCIRIPCGNCPGEKSGDQEMLHSGEGLLRRWFCHGPQGRTFTAAADR